MYVRHDSGVCYINLTSNIYSPGMYTLKPNSLKKKHVINRVS